VDQLSGSRSSARKELLHELHHAKSHEFKDTLKQQLDLNEKASQKIEPKAKRG
jgi:hypothetical protein